MNMLSMYKATVLNLLRQELHWTY